MTERLEAWFFLTLGVALMLCALAAAAATVAAIVTNA